MLQPDSTLSTVGKSTVRFAVGDLHPLDAGLGAARQAVGGALAPLVEIGSESPVSPPSNTGGNYLGVDRDAIKSGDVDDGVFTVSDASSTLSHSSGTDYFRLTCDNTHHATRLALECAALAREFKTRGDRERPWRYVGGYEDGWTCGPISYAEGRNAVLVQASGVASDPLFLACKRGFFEVRPTRFDVQTTVVLAEDDPGYARRMAERADAYRRSGEREGYPFKVHVRDGFGDGDTLEIGTRGSEVYLRLYDKHREGFKKTHSKQVQPGQFAPGSWRYEAELKGGSATELYCRLFEAPDGSEGHSQAVLTEVRGLFTDRGLDLPVGEGVAKPIRELRYRSDVDRQRTWLRSAVRPSIKQLIADGYLAEVLHDLGLDELDCVDLSQLLLTRPVEK